MLKERPSGLRSRCWRGPICGSLNGRELLWCHASETCWKLALGNLLKSALWGAKESCSWEVSHQKHSATKSPLEGAKESCWPLCTAAAKHWRCWMCFRSQAQSKQPAPQKLGPEEAARIAGTWQISHQKQEEKAFLLQYLPNTLCWEDLTWYLLAKEKYLKDPDLFSQNRQWRVNLLWRSNTLIRGHRWHNQNGCFKRVIFLKVWSEVNCEEKLFGWACFSLLQILKWQMTMLPWHVAGLAFPPAAS